ncbi:Vacuolar protein sorting-associated protein vps5 [Vanrija albida]|uniref:Vacuolar protein sorting-associated protein vps5 n=1 Tax=Vanrija albida TaxID=181172 RepID=A0ABR3QEN1_9TREE
MDEEESFARLLSASTPAPRPTLFSNSSTEADPWANPFNDSGPSWGPPVAAAREPEPEPEQEEYAGFGGFGATVPDPPSVIAAREREELAHAHSHPASKPSSPQHSTDPYAPSGFVSPPRTSPSAALGRSAARSPPTSPSKPASQQQHARALPAGLIDEELLAESDPQASLKRAFVASAATAPSAAVPPTPEKKGTYVFRPKPVDTKRRLPTDPAAVPLPDSAVPSRPDTPHDGAPAPVHANAPTPGDRVSVSPLETPGAADDYGFQSLAIGGATNGIAARIGGRGWGAVDADEGPLAGGSDPWNEGGGGWEAEREAEPEPEPAVPSPTGSGPSRVQAREGSLPGSPRRSKLLSTPVFQISVSNPTKVGDPVRGHVVYTVNTKTTSPHYRRGEFSVLRRFSDFLWLYEALLANNPGVFVPPVPDKHVFGRFQDQFIETRRSALQRCLTKITSHPILQLDPDLRLFLESDSFALDIKNRGKAPTDTPPNTGVLASWTGPRYVEQDDWFDQKKLYLDHLETQLKGVSKSLDVASKARLELAHTVGEFSDASQALAESDLGAAMCAALGRLADLTKKERTFGEEQATSDVAQLLNLADEYVRFIGSVRLSFASRVRAYHTAQAADKEVQRVRQARDKARQQGKLADRAAASLAELGEAERRSRDAAADFEAQSKLVKAEFARFERERVDEFRKTLTIHLDGQIARQRELVTAWEEYHAMLLKMVQRAQAQQQAQAAAAAQAV